MAAAAAQNRQNAERAGIVRLIEHVLHVFGEDGEGAAGAGRDDRHHILVHLPLAVLVSGRTLWLSRRILLSEGQVGAG